MLTPPFTMVLNAAKIAFAVLPWLLSMYLLYRFEVDTVWTSATPHRGKLSVAILCAGMALTFWLLSTLFKREQR